MPNAIITFALRGSQIIFSVVVLGLSVNLLKGHLVGDKPIPLGYAAFVGATSLLGAIIGIASNWVELLQGIIGAAIDGVILIINIIGGIIFAYKLRGTSCGDKSLESMYNLGHNSLISGGCAKFEKETYCLYYDNGFFGKIQSRCRENQADTVFMFLTAVIVIACLTMTFLHLKR